MPKRKTKKEKAGAEKKRQRTAEELKSSLFHAVKKGNLEELKKIANECPVENDQREDLLNSCDDRRRTLLHVAVEENQVAIINWLLSEKEGEGRSLGFHYVLSRGSYMQRTVLHSACEIGLEVFLAVVNGCRVDNGEREELINAVDRRNKSVVDLAIYHEQASIISWLFSAEGGGMDLELRRNETSWDIATVIYDLKCFLAVVNSWRVDNGERRKMLNAVDNEGRTVLHKAAKFGRKEIITWILSDEGGRAAGFDCVLSRTDDGQTALYLASMHDLERFLAVLNGLRIDNGERQEMLNAVNNKGWTVLHRAAECGREDIIVWLLSNEGGRGAGFNSVSAKTTKKDLTALHFAVQYHFNSNPARALLSNCTNEERINLFLAVDKNGWTALHEAARDYRMMPVITELLSYSECGLIVDRKDNRGMTVLHRTIIGGIDEESRREWAPHEFKPHQEIIRSLLGFTCDSSSSSSSTTITTAAAAFIDPNIGLGLQ